METIVENKTQTIEQNILAYVNKTARHLFLTEDNYFFKVLPLKIKDTWYRVTIQFNGENSSVNITEVNHWVHHYDNNAKHELKRSMFPQHYAKKASIKNFKLMKEKMFEVQKVLLLNYDGTNANEVKDKINTVLKGLAPKA